MPPCLAGSSAGSSRFFTTSHVAFLQAKNEIGAAGDPTFQALRYYQLFYEVGTIAMLRWSVMNIRFVCGLIQSRVLQC